MRAQESRYNFIVWCRAIAVLSVLWFHLVQSFCSQNSIAFLPDMFARQYLLDPLHLDAGQFGVTLFFVVSGFIITHVAFRETIAEFAVKRFFRIYPPLIISVIIMALMIPALWVTPYPIPSIMDVVHSSIIVHLWVVKGVTLVNPVLWTLIIELLFYVTIAIMADTLKRWPRLTMLGFLTAEAALIATYPISPVLAAPLVYPTLVAPLFFGQVVYLAWSQRIALPIAATFLAGWWFLGEWAAQVHSAAHIASNAVAIWRIIAYLIFTALLLAGQIKVPRPIGFVADTSYSIYLLHMPLGYLPMYLTVKVLGYPPALAVALVVTFLGSWACYRWIETPSQDFARSLIRSGRSYWRTSRSRRPIEQRSVDA